MIKILVVDDEKEITDLIALYLENDGYKVYKEYDGGSALSCVKKYDIDLAIIDIMLPDIDGFELCGEIRKDYNFPIIMLTAKSEEIDKIRGLTIGADDYITKPFKPLELLARVKAHLRRYTRYNIGQNKGDKVIVRDLALDLDKHICTLKGEEINFTPTEFAIVKALILNVNKVMSADDIFKEVWQEEYYTSENNTVMVHIRHIREKIREHDDQEYIKTVWGVGYKIEE